MEDEINLRPYLEILLRNWLLILGGVILAVLTAFIASSSMAPTFEATALVVESSPRQKVQFDPRFEATGENLQSLQAYPELAASDDLLLTLLSQLEPPSNDIATLDDMRDIVAAESGSDPSIIHLTVKYSDPGRTAEIANLWAALFVTRANEIYGDQGGEQVEFFESQLKQAATELAAAEDALINYQSLNRSSIIENELKSLNMTQVRYLEEQQSIAFLTQDITGLREQLEAQSGSGTANFADQLTALFLQLKAFGAEADSSETSIPLQLQLNAEELLSQTTRNEQIELLANLENTLETQLIQTSTTLAELEPQILDLQQQKQGFETESARLTRDRDVVNETYTALARKVAEEGITSQDTTSGVRLASRAAIPEKKVAPRTLLNSALAGIVALMVIIFLIFAVEWWRAGDDTAGIDNPTIGSGEHTVLKQDGSGSIPAQRSPQEPGN